MNIKSVQEKVEELKKNSPKRNFKQSVDLIIVLKDINLKNPDEQVDFYIDIETNKKKRICAIVGTELKANASDYDFVITEKDLDSYKNDAKKVKKLANEYDYFIAQANLMPQIAQIFGKYLGPRGKMPNPKAGCIVNIKTDLKTLYKKLQRMIRVQAKNQMQVQVFVGKEDMDSERIAENIVNVMDQLIHHLPKGADNIRKVLIKFTMGPPIEVGLR